MTGSVGLRDGYRRNLNIVEDYSLTPRERQILSLVAQGKRNKDISQSLGISMCTVRSHLSNIFSKLGVGCRSEAVRVAFLHGEVLSNLKVWALYSW